MANTRPVYAVVDKSKKTAKKKVPSSMVPESFDSPVYDNTAGTVVEPSNERFDDAQYSMIAMDSMYSTLGQTTPPSTESGASSPSSQHTKGKVDKKRWYRTTGCRILACLFIVIAVVFLILLICIAVLFAEVVELRQRASQDSESAAIEGTSVMALDTRLNTVIQQLNTSIEALKQSQSISSSSVQMELMQLNQQVSSLQNTSSIIIGALPLPSCAVLLALSPSAPSGEYPIKLPDGTIRQVYCNMTLTCGGVTGGWMRVAELDMTDSSEQCPTSLMERRDGSIRTCGPRGPGCAAATFPVISEYDRVCGRIIAFQRGSLDTFQVSGGTDIYLDGVSLTHGSPRQHIWSFAAGLDETDLDPGFNCACTRNFTGDVTMYSQPPAFVGDHYFCDTGSRERFVRETFYSDNPLWDGAGCGPMNACCSFNNPPWFYRKLPQPTTDAIEMRLCRDQTRFDEDIQIQTIEIFVQ